MAVCAEPWAVFGELVSGDVDWSVPAKAVAVAVSESAVRPVEWITTESDWHEFVELW